MRLSFFILCSLLLTACISIYPLNMTEVEWNALTKEEKYQARLKQAEFDAQSRYHYNEQRFIQQQNQAAIQTAAAAAPKTNVIVTNSNSNSNSNVNNNSANAFAVAGSGGSAPSAGGGSGTGKPSVQCKQVLQKAYLAMKKKEHALAKTLYTQAIALCAGTPQEAVARAALTQIP